MFDYYILFVAAFFAGMLNTVAGGGTFLTFPVLVYIGMPVVAANATSAVAVFPGYLGGVVGFRKEINAIDKRILLKISAATIVGGALGSILLLVSSNAAFSVVVPFLLALATLIFAFTERIQKWASEHTDGIQPGGSLSMALVAVYGGYFNGGLGIVLLALFSLWGMKDINKMNGLKAGMSFLLSAVSVATFAAAGLVAWPQAFVMMIAATLGGYLGAPLARALPQSVVRAIVVLVGASMSVVFAARVFLGD